MINNPYYTISMISSSTRSYLSVNNYSNETYPTNYCSCCCSFSLNSTKLLLPLPFNPTLLLPPRQSSLIHWAPPSRLLLGLGGGYGFLGSGCDVGRCYFRESCCGSEDMMWGCSYGVKCCGGKEGVGVGKKKGGGGYGFRGSSCDVGRCCFGGSCCGKEDMMWDRSYSVKCCGSKKGVGVGSKKGRGKIERSGYLSNALGDVDAMLSLLAEDTDKVCFEGRENRRGVGKGRRVVEEHIVVCEEFDDIKNGSGDVGCLYSGNDMEKLGRVRYREEGCERREVERLSMGKDSRLRRKESSSSYYSPSDFESDGEDEVERERFVGESSTSHGNDSRKVGVVIKEDSKKDSKRYTDKTNQQLQGSSSVLDRSKIATSTEWDCRKKSEKKLAMGLSEETKSKKDSHSLKVSSSKKHFNYDKQESTSRVNSHWKSWSHIKTNDNESAYYNVNEAETSARKRSEVGEGVVMVDKADQQNKSKNETQQHGEVSDSRDDGRLDGGPQYYNEMVGPDDGYGESSSRTHRRVESRTKNVEEQSTKKGNEAIKISQTSLSASQVNSSNTEISNLTVSQQRLYDERAFLASRLKSIEEEISKQKQNDERMRQYIHKTDRKAIGIQPSVTLTSHTAIQQVSQVENESNIHISMVGPSYQYIEESKYGHDGDNSSPRDTLGSVARMEETSNQFVGEFVEKMEKTSSQIGSSNEDDVKTRLQKQGSRGSSGVGPSDEMWDVRDHFPQTPDEEMEPLEGPTFEDSVPKRTGKSLWNVVSGVFRWGSQSETLKSSGQTSSNETASGQTWVSANDDEVNGQSLRTEESNVSAQSTSSDKLGSKRVEDDTNVIQQTPQSTPSFELPTPPTTQLRISHAYEETEGASQNEGVITSSEVSSDAEMKQSKLKRTTQFQKERYEAWEDAYKRENEQRKVDEIFMREALVEARKASDSWEVPVGAVLAHNGKIIARGYNLVEELRDSTAHAEMICIREASNALKTWRLSETTLYVTLEPCPMCAGAILQARVGTVVWGAPNKLLGADGSWIRLFPNGQEEEQRQEVSDKPAAPIHPFHPKMNVRRGVLDAECAGIMQDFFKLRRKKQKEKEEKEKTEEEAHSSSCLHVPHRPRFFHKMHGAFHFLFCL